MLTQFKKKHAKPYTATMPSTTAELCERFKISNRMCFQLQIEFATHLLMKLIPKHEQMRFKIYELSDFWEWFLGEWEAIDSLVILGSEFREDGSALVDYGTGKMGMTRTQQKTFYVKRHLQSVEAMTLESLPHHLRIQIDRIYRTLKTV